MKRLFCAVMVPPEQAVVSVLQTMQQSLAGEAIKWVEPNNIHITLKFFGDTHDRDIPGIINALGGVTTEVSRFDFSLVGCNTFGSVRQARVIWMGIRNPGSLVHLYNRINDRLSTLGYEPDIRLFNPHLTLGRIKQLHNYLALEHLLGKYADTAFAKVDIHSFYLMQSILKPTGPVYKVLHTFRLKG